MGVPQFAHEANHDDPKEFMSWFLSDWPKIEKAQPYPSAPRPFLPYHSQLGWDLGFRYHPELATLKKVATKDGVAFIPVGDDDPVVGDTTSHGDEVAALLAQVDPGYAERIAGMTPAERHDALEGAKAEAEKAIEVLKRLSEVLPTDGGGGL